MLIADSLLRERRIEDYGRKEKVQRKTGPVREAPAVEASSLKLPFKSVEVRSFVHATEGLEKVKEIFRSLLPEEIGVEESRAKGHHGDQITILSTRIDRNPDIREFWHQVMKMMPNKEKEKLSEVAVDRIAEDCRLYLRFDKQAAVDEELILVESGDALHIRINVSAYPAKREIAVEEMRKFLSSGLESR